MADDGVAEDMEHTPTSPIPFDELLGHRAWVRNLARSLVRDQATADDVEQQTWLAALRNPPSERASVRAWFATVVRNSVRERGRAQGRRTRRETVVARPEGQPGTADVADVVARAESHKRVVLAVMDLPEPYRRTVLLRFFEDLPPRDVAARMGAPVETVRTRTRRALALLRECMDVQEKGDRRAWKRALAPLLLPLSGAESGTDTAHATGDRKMLALRMAAVAALLIAIPTGVELIGSGGARQDPLGDGETAAALAAPEDGNGGGRARVEPPRPAPPKPESGDSEAEEVPRRDPKDGRTNFGPVGDPLPTDAEASVYANGKIVISLSVDPEHPRAGEPFAIVTTFRNVGTGPARFHVPEFSGTVPFPHVTLRSGDGTLYVPVPPSFQTMAGRGVLGRIVRLEVGAEHAVKSPVSQVANVSDAEAHNDRPRGALRAHAHDLLPGDFTLGARLIKRAATVPFADKDYAVSNKPVAGLWTGDIRATEVSMRLAPPDQPMLMLSGPTKLDPAGDMTLTLEISNPSDEEKQVRGAFRIWRAQKGSTPFFAAFDLADRALVAAPNDASVLTLAPGETRTCAIDLGALLWAPLSDRSDWIGRARWPWARDSATVWVTCGARKADDRTGSNTLFVSIAPAADLADKGLRLTVETGSLFAQEGFIGVHLRNNASDERAVPARIRTPSRLLISLHRTDAQRRRPEEVRIVDDEPYRSLRIGDIVVLGTGEELYARIALRSDWREKVPAGKYLLRAYWANLDACDRDGFDAAHRPVVGRLTSTPIEIIVPADD